MKDKNQNDIKIGDSVVCVDPIEGFLQLNKIYIVLDLRESEKRLVLNPDERGLEGHYLSKRFIVLKSGESDIF